MPQGKSPGRAGRPISSHGYTAEQLLRHAMQVPAPASTPTPTKKLASKKANKPGKKRDDS